MADKSRIRADIALKYVAIYYCLCGLIALGLDIANGLKNGQFTVISEYSLFLMRWLAPIGVVGSLFALILRPSRLILQAAALLLLITFSLGSVFTWIMWSYQN